MTTEPSTVTLGTTTYRIRTQTFAPDVATGVLIWLHAPNGGVYYLVPTAKRATHTGLYGVFSFATGDPLPIDGRDAQVVAIGGIIEPAPY